MNLLEIIIGSKENEIYECVKTHKQYKYCEDKGLLSRLYEPSIGNEDCWEVAEDTVNDVLNTNVVKWKKKYTFTEALDRLIRAYQSNEDLPIFTPADEVHDRRLVIINNIVGLDYTTVREYKPTWDLEISDCQRLWIER